MTFRLNGKPLSTRPVPPRILRVKRFLDTLPDNELLTSRELAKRTGYSHDVVSNEMGRHSALEGYVLAVRFPGRQNVWGNQKTIRELSKHKEILA